MTTTMLQQVSTDALVRYEQMLFARVGAMEEHMDAEAIQGSQEMRKWSAVYDELERRDFWESRYEWEIDFPPKRSIFDRIADAIDRLF